MNKEQLIQIIQDRFDEEDSILIDDLYEIFLEEGEATRNEALLRALHDSEFEIKFNDEIDKVIRDLAVRITQYIFRSGSIEDFHAGKYSFEDFDSIPSGTAIEEISQLTDENMKVLNKELVDKIGFLIYLFSQADYLNLNFAINGYKFYGDDWDAPNIEEMKEKHNQYLLLVTRMDNYVED